jgi:hypothetical protein
MNAATVAQIANSRIAPRKIRQQHQGRSDLNSRIRSMTDWFARPVLHVKNVEASLRFYVNQLGFTSPWRHNEDGKADVAQVERQGCALILADSQRSPRWTRCALNWRPRAFRSRMVRGAIGFWWSMISTAISSSSTIRTRLHPARLLEMKHDRYRSAGNQLRTYLLNQSMVRCQARSAAALTYRSGVASQLKPCPAPG